jgi:predicted ferric reductase
VIGGPHGHSDLRRGTARQVWIAAGVGVAPFLSWLRSLRADSPLDVDFFYTAAGRAPYSEEILELSAALPGVRVPLIDSVTDGRLSSEHVLQELGGELTDVSVYMCGPEPMLGRFQTDLRRAGIPRTRIHRDYFDRR